MPTLNLETKDKAQERIKAYLEKNASDVLADKINNGVLIEKDGKKLINRKTLDGFNVYSFQTVLNGTTYSKQEFTFDGKHVKGCVVDDPELFNMAIHYFEEDSIEGTLYNEDGTEFKPPKPVAKTKPATTYTPPAPKPKPQMSLFDLIDKQKAETATVPEIEADAEPDEEEPTEEERREAAENDVEEQQFTIAVQPQGSPFYLVGFPCHAANTYIAKAVSKGLKVAVFDSPGDNSIELYKSKNEQKRTLPEPPESDKHWIDDTTYIDDGIVHDIKTETEETAPAFDMSAFDTEALAKLDGIFGDLLDLR